MRWYQYIYMNEACAAKIGFTHSGWLYGVPVWLHFDDDEEEFLACPKFVPLQLYNVVVDTAFAFLIEAVTLVTGQDLEVNTPYSVTRAINPALSAKEM